MRRIGKTRPPARTRLLVIAAMVIGVPALVPVLWATYETLMVSHWMAQLTEADDARVPMLLGHLAAMGDRGIPALVEAMGSDRETVARAARRCLSDRLARWELLDPQEASRKLAILAEALADQVEGFPLPARRDAAELAARILRWPLHARAFDQTRVVAACDRVIRTTGAERRILAEADRLNRLQYTPLGSATTADASPGDLLRGGFPDPTAESDGTRLATIAELPGGGLPIELPEAFAPLPPHLRQLQVASREPGRLIAPPVADTAQPLRRPWPLPSSAAGGARPIPLTPGPGAIGGGVQDRASRTGVVGTTALGDPGPHGQLSGVRHPAALAGVDAAVLIRSLGAENEPDGPVHAQLTRRGFTEVDFELARRLTAPNPAVRSQMVEVLPTLQSVDGAWWLLQLARDENVEVRLAAISMLATTGNPVVLKQVEQIAGADPEARVRQYAQRIADRRRAPPR